MSSGSDRRGFLGRLRGRSTGPRTDPLEGLDDVAWSRLDDAYGPATAVPVLLRTVVARKANVGTWDELYSRLAHQGTVYQASAAAVPLLLRALPHLRTIDTIACLELLESIATGGASDEAITRAVREHLRSGIDDLYRYLEHREPAVRETAARLVGCRADEALARVESWESRIRAETDDEARSTLIDMYGRFAPVRHARARAFLEEQLARLHGHAAVHAALAISRAAPGDTDPRWLDLVFGEIAAPSRSLPCVLVEPVMESLWRVVPRDVLLDALLRALPRARTPARAHDVGAALLFIGFSDRLGEPPATRPRPLVEVMSSEFPWPNPYLVREWDFPSPGFWEDPEKDVGVTCNIAMPMRPDAMSEQHRQLLRALLRNEAFWTPNPHADPGDMSDGLRIYGLPSDRVGLGALLRS